MKVIIATPVFGRFEIFKIFFDSFMLNKKSLAGVLDMKLALSGNYASDKKIFDYYMNNTKQEDVLWHDIDERVLSTKWNYFIPTLKEHDFDFVVISGSDDIYSDSYWLKFYQLAKTHDYIGLLDFFLLDIETMRTKHWNGFHKEKQGHAIGAGRWISRAIVEALEYKLCEDGKKTGVDLSMQIRIAQQTKNPINVWCKDEAIAMMDIKSQENIWAYDHWQGAPVDGSYMLPAFFSREIIKKIVYLNSEIVKQNGSI